MIERVKEKLEKLTPSRRGRLATLLVTGSLAITGCGGSSSSAPVEKPVKADPMEKSLNDYGDAVNYKRRARVAMNTCVAWENISGGITVTQNPGVATAKYGNQDYSYFVWSYPDSDKRSPLIQQMDGAQTLVTDKGVVYGGGPDGTILTIDLENQKGYLAHATTRKLSDKPTFADNGQVYFEDVQTGQPVMNTVVTDRPLTIKNQFEVCDELSRGEVVNALEIR